jgi:hypothetical protein
MRPADFPDFRVTTCQRIGPDMVTIRWAIQPTAWDLTDLAFLVFRSYSHAGPWDWLAEMESGLWTYHDAEAHGAGTYRDPYYIIRICSKTSKGYRDSRPIRSEHNPDHIAIDMVRKKLLFMEHRGIPAAALIKRRQGTNCGRCYNQQQQDATDAQCPECFGTGFSGGYYTPVLIPCATSLPERALQMGPVELESGQVGWETANWPTLNHGDLIVDRQMNIRYRIDRVHPTSHRQHLISQILVMTRIDEMDIAHTIPVPLPENSAAGRSFDNLDRTKPKDIHATASAIDF